MKFEIKRQHIVFWFLGNKNAEKAKRKRQDLYYLAIKEQNKTKLYYLPSKIKMLFSKLIFNKTKPSLGFLTSLYKPNGLQWFYYIKFNTLMYSLLFCMSSYYLHIAFCFFFFWSKLNFHSTGPYCNTATLYYLIRKQYFKYF